jgi:hypothetical protein
MVGHDDDVGAGERTALPVQLKDAPDVLVDLPAQILGCRAGSLGVHGEVGAGEVGDLEVRQAVAPGRPAHALPRVLVELLEGFERVEAGKLLGDDLEEVVEVVEVGRVAQIGAARDEAHRHVGAHVRALEERRHGNQAPEQVARVDAEGLLVGARRDGHGRPRAERVAVEPLVAGDAVLSGCTPGEHRRPAGRRLGGHDRDHAGHGVGACK